MLENTAIIDSSTTPNLAHSGEHWKLIALPFRWLLTVHSIL